MFEALLPIISILAFDTIIIGLLCIKEDKKTIKKIILVSIKTLLTLFAFIVWVLGLYYVCYKLYTAEFGLFKLLIIPIMPLFFIPAIIIEKMIKNYEQ